MLSTLCQSAAPSRIIAPWAWMIAGFFQIIVKTILMIVENVCDALHELRAYCRKAGRGLMALRPGLSADIGVAPARITDNCGLDLDVSLFAPRYWGKGHGFRKA